MNIRLLKREKIDEGRWRECVQTASNGNVFAQVWLLDLICPEWEAIVAGDYDAVLPIPVKRTWGIKHVYRPEIVPYIGIVNKVPIDFDVYRQMLEAIPYANIHLLMNAHNKLPNGMAKKKYEFRYVVLDLISDVERLKNSFSRDLVQVMELYDSKQLTVVRALDVSSYLMFAQTNKQLSPYMHRLLTKLIPFALRYKSAGLYAAYDAHNQMMAGAFLLKSKTSLILLHCASPEVDNIGVKAIVYHIIKNNPVSNLTLEFPFCSNNIGTSFSSTEHICLGYKKGLSQWIDL
ncbi:hypothetical protein KEM09_01370 [Carboxylicivirga mesophila]|uniref:BioF2-like acetyltransferase domain-containing protein n=1 Tax=Carboxylicivirga mesophila TaxID=1166478 RepID=A0ABS5K4U5_9BACT|nr:hypothetical protein [Carboxylicivirga mesophila]MBS2210030.1 hypothetical protein [Carboxylicivirga mesophila]